VPTLRGKVARQHFPSGQDGQVLVLDTASPHGIAWRSGIDRLVTDITPELAGDLDCQGYELTSVGGIGFTAGTSLIAGIQNQNLVDKSAGAFTADLAMGTNKITGMGTPGASTDAATKGYVDTAVGAAPLTRAFWYGHKTVSLYTLTGLTQNADNWETAPASWTAEESTAWTESSGEWAYTGAFPASGSRFFRVNYHFVIDGYTTVTWWRMQGRITYKPNGGAFAVVPGSIMSGQTYSYTSVFGVFVQRHHVHGTCIVEISHANDRISFQYGNYCSTIGSGTFIAGNLRTFDSGISLTISPVDINP
jgi:hypothetical protein